MVPLYDHCEGTEISFRRNNPKRPGTDAHRRYEINKKARTIQQARSSGATRGDLAWDFERGFITLVGRPDSAPPDRVATKNRVHRRRNVLTPETPSPRRAKHKRESAAQIRHKAYRLLNKTSPAALDKLVAVHDADYQNRLDGHRLRPLGQHQELPAAPQGSQALAQPQGSQALAQDPRGPTRPKRKETAAEARHRLARRQAEAGMNNWEHLFAVQDAREERDFINSRNRANQLDGHPSTPAQPATDAGGATEQQQQHHQELHPTKHCQQTGPSCLQLARPNEDQQALLQLAQHRGAAVTNSPRTPAPCARIRLACAVGRAMEADIGNACALYVTRLATAMLTMLRGVGTGAMRCRVDDVADVLATCHASWCFLYGDGAAINPLFDKRRPRRDHESAWDANVESAQRKALLVLSANGACCIRSEGFKRKFAVARATLMMAVFSSAQRLPW